MTQYLLSVYHGDEPGLSPEDLLTPGEMQQSIEDCNALNDRLRAAGAWVFAGGLHLSSSATVLRGSGDEVAMTDGPFLEGKEHIGGFWIIEAADLDTALEWGRQATRACRFPVEVRPFQNETDG
jgi:hypothetical protein